MKLQAKEGHFLTENFDVQASERRFLQNIELAGSDEAKYWKEVSQTEKEAMEFQSSLFGDEGVSYGYLKKLETVESAIPKYINEAGLTAGQALEMQKYYPEWGGENAPIGKEVANGFRFKHHTSAEEDYTLYEVIQPHTLSAEWVPGVGTESLYKVVTEHEGTKEDPIPWEHNMELVEGKYYTDKGILYLCIRNSGIALSYDLADLVSGGYVEPVTEEPEQPEEGEGTDNPEEGSGENTGDGEGTSPEQPAEPDGTLENPIPYTAGKTELLKDKYYIEDGITYVCIQNGGVQIYKLSEMPAIAQPI